MRLAGLAGEGGRHGQDLGAGQRLGAEELREAHIVADREPSRPTAAISDARLAPGR